MNKSELSEIVIFNKKAHEIFVVDIIMNTFYLT